MTRLITQTHGIPRAYYLLCDGRMVAISGFHPTNPGFASPSVGMEIKAHLYAERMKTKVVRRSYIRTGVSDIHPDFPFALLPANESCVQTYVDRYKQMREVLLLGVETPKESHEVHKKAYYDLQRWLCTVLDGLDEVGVTEA